MIYCAGIDGGQTSTKAAIVNEAGAVVGRGLGRGLDHMGSPGALEAAAAAIREALAGARAEAGLAGGTPLAVAVAGLTGFGGAEAAVTQAVAAGRVRVTHDAPIALAGALELAPGIVAIAGTGSVVYGEDARGHSVTLGGWGYLFGDAGSAFWIARRALEVAMTAEDTGGAKHGLGSAALAYFDLPALRVLARDVYQQRISRERLAGFARLVSDAARMGEPAAVAIFEEGAQHLAACCAAAAAHLGLDEPRVATVGGAFGSLELRARFVAQLEAKLPGVQISEPVLDPATGAALLALREARRVGLTGQTV